jgi:hypothetical protein
VLFFFLNSSHVAPSQSLVQDDPVLAPDVAVSPVIDGTGDDPCWQTVPWQGIDQQWIPYGAFVPSDDYLGRYKVVWSSTTNLLYFLVQVTDDVFVDGYVPGMTSDIYNFDVVEVFIDEDRSGGLHVFDSTGVTGREWGTNAENAFAYHIYASFPGEGHVTKGCYVYDLAGTSWSDAKKMNYTSHLPAFALCKTRHTALWEFSLIVYDDTYEDTAKDAARTQLYVGKEMGLSLAYCDNDDPNENPKTRDNFFGSVWVPGAAYNDHWKNADYFGRMRLVSGRP